LGTFFRGGSTAEPDEALTISSSNAADPVPVVRLRRTVDASTAITVCAVPMAGGFLRAIEHVEHGSGWYARCSWCRQTDGRS